MLQTLDTRAIENGDEHVIKLTEAPQREHRRTKDTWWVGAVTSRGHGLFWLADGAVVIAHRYAFARVHGVDTLLSAPGLAHDCDNPLCQNHEHLAPKSTAENAHDWSVRRRHFAGPLADPRGSRRALAIRDGLRAGGHLADLLEEGRTELDRRQLSLW